MEAVLLLNAVLSQAAQAAEAAGITISFGTAGGLAMGGGIPTAVLLSWLGYKKYKKNGSGDPETKEVLKQLVDHMADAKEDRQEDRELRKEMLKAVQGLDRRDARMEDRLGLVYSELQSLKK